MHAPRVVHYDLVAKTHRTRENTYDVDVYMYTDKWLYIARPLVNHPHIAYMKVYVIPSLGVQVNRFTWHDGPPTPRYDYDYYVDIIRVVEQGDVWVVRDLYLDLVVYEGERVTVLDTDEYLAAIKEDHFEEGEAERALTVTHDTLNALAQHEYSLEDYLSAKGVDLDWS